MADEAKTDEAGETSSTSGEEAQPPPVAAIGWADESSEREVRKRQRTGTTIELAECEVMRRLSQMER